MMVDANGNLVVTGPTGSASIGVPPGPSGGLPAGFVIGAETRRP